MPLTPEQTLECSKLKKLFDEKSELSQRAFAKKFNLGTPANLSQYLLGRRPLNLKMAMTLAGALGVNVSDFSPRLAKEIEKFKSEPSTLVKSGRPHTKRIPLLSFVQAGLSSISGDNEYDNWIDVDESEPDTAYAVMIKGSSMEPIFSEGQIVIVNPEICPKPGDYVIARLANNYKNEATLKQYAVTAIDEYGRDIFELRPLNPLFPTLRSNEINICGVVVERRERFR